MRANTLPFLFLTLFLLMPLAAHADDTASVEAKIENPQQSSWSASTLSMLKVGALRWIGLPALAIAGGWWNKKNEPEFTIATLDKSHWGSQLVSTIQSTALKMELDPSTKVIDYSGLAGSPAAAGHKVLLIDEHLMNFFPPEEQEFIIGHECSHIMHNDALKSFCLSLAMPFISLGLLKGYEFLSHHSIDLLRKKFCTQDSSVDEFLANLDAINTNITNNPVFYYFFTIVLNNMLQSRRIETRADHHAATTLKNSNVGIESFKHFSSKEYIQLVLQQLGKNFKKISILQLPLIIASVFDIMLFSSHPSTKTRIAALAYLGLQESA